MQVEEALRRLCGAAALAVGRGSLIFHLDLATEAGRTALAARGVPTDALATLVDEDGYWVLALGAGATSRVLGQASFDECGDIVVNVAERPVPPAAEALARARRTVDEARLGAASRRVVPVILPPADLHVPLEAYALAVDPSPGAPVIDGHWRLALTPDGRRITGRTPMSAGTLVGPAFTFADLGAVPSELHTYLSLKHDAPLLVDTRESGLRWRVDGERVDVILEPA